MNGRKKATTVERGKTNVNPVNWTVIGGNDYRFMVFIYVERYGNRHKCKHVCVCLPIHIFPSSLLREALGGVIC